MSSRASPVFYEEGQSAGWGLLAGCAQPLAGKIPVGGADSSCKKPNLL